MGPGSNPSPRGHAQVAAPAIVLRMGAPGATPSHPFEPDPDPPENDAESDNPTQLPIEPEFDRALPAAEPEDPGVKKPAI